MNTDIMSVGTRYGLDELSLVKLRTGELIAYFYYLERKCMRKVAYSVLRQGFWLWICCRVGSDDSMYSRKIWADDSELLNPDMVTGLVVLHAERYLNFWLVLWSVQLCAC